MSLLKVCIFVCILTIYLSQITTTEYQPRTSSDTRLPTNNRSKRFLIFRGNGVLKMVLGFSQPMDLQSKFPNRQLALTYAFHLQYTPPTIPVYWWTYFVNSTAWAHTRTTTGRQRIRKDLPMSHSDDGTKVHKRNYHHNPHLNHYDTFVQRHYRQPAIIYDASRFVVYKAIETIFNSKGLPGERCLLRTICEISQRPLYEINAIHGILNVIFSPRVPNVDKIYLRAMQIGINGIDCGKIYWSCSQGFKWLEQMTYYL